MELYEKILKRIEADLPIYDNIEYAKDLEAIAKEHYGNKFSLHSVVKSLNEKETLSFEEWTQNNGYTRNYNEPTFIDSDWVIFQEHDLVKKFNDEVMNI